MIACACARSHAAPPGASAAAASSARRSRLVQLAAPDVRLGLDQAQRPAASARRAARHPELGALDRRAEIVGAQRLRGRALVPAHGARRLAAAAEVLGQRHRVARRPPAPATRPRAGGRARDRRRSASRRPPRAPARARTVNSDVRRARSGVAARATSSRAARRSMRVRHVGQLGLAAEQRRHARRARSARRTRRRAQHALGLAPLGVEARLHHPEHGVGQRRRARPAGGRADQLLEVERVAVGALDDRLPRRRPRRRPAPRAPASRWRASTAVPGG